MILEPGDLPVFVCALISFGSKEEVRIVAYLPSALCFPFMFEGEQSVFYVQEFISVNAYEFWSA